MASKVREASVMEHFQDGNKTNIHLFQIRAFQLKQLVCLCKMKTSVLYAVFAITVKCADLYNSVFSLNFDQVLQIWGSFQTTKPAQNPYSTGCRRSIRQEPHFKASKPGQSKQQGQLRDTDLDAADISVGCSRLCQVSCVLMLTTCDDINMEQQNMEFDRK